jgi:hypothetical protein
MFELIQICLNSSRVAPCHRDPILHPFPTADQSASVGSFFSSVSSLGTRRLGRSLSRATTGGHPAPRRFSASVVPRIFFLDAASAEQDASRRCLSRPRSEPLPGSSSPSPSSTIRPSPIWGWSCPMTEPRFSPMPSLIEPLMRHRTLSQPSLPLPRRSRTKVVVPSSVRVATRS